ncbi:PoNe immunity protein domain-containing protein [Chryseobacterium ginsengisoli]|uniref:PoNe immunity protein domain-containing protein n=1 Tax=Chryseobacterium ginsengisoli TaxID=363853 RepID=UPI0031E802A1
MISKEDPDDYLIDFLLGKKTTWEKQSKDFKFPKPYQSLQQVISLGTNGEKEKAINNLKLYLDQEWYKGHSDAGWYDNHKSKHNTYAGYWSWESAALVKILDLDDSILKNQKFLSLRYGSF